MKRSRRTPSWRETTACTFSLDVFEFDCAELCRRPARIQRPQPLKRRSRHLAEDSGHELSELGVREHHLLDDGVQRGGAALVLLLEELRGPVAAEVDPDLLEEGLDQSLLPSSLGLSFAVPPDHGRGLYRLASERGTEVRERGHVLESPRDLAFADNAWGPVERLRRRGRGVGAAGHLRGASTVLGLFPARPTSFSCF